MNIITYYYYYCYYYYYSKLLLERKFKAVECSSLKQNLLNLWNTCLILFAV